MARVLIASDYFHPHWTGIVKSMVRLSRRLATGDVVTVVTVRYDPDLARDETWDGVRIVRASPLFRVSRAYYSLTAIGTFLRMLPRHDVVLVNSPCTNVLAFAVAARLFGKRLVIFHQGDLILGPGMLNRFVHLIFFWHTRIAMALAHTVSTYSRDYALHSALLRPVLDKLEPTLMPVEPAGPERSLTTGSDDARLRTLERRGRSGAILIGFAGRFVEEKGFDVLLRAIPRVIEALPQAHFVFAGETEIFYEDFYQRQRPLLERLEGHVTSLGLLPEPPLRRFYEAIDLFVLPSRSDCFALVQAEAALAGTPLVVADIPGARVLVRETGCGVLFEPEDPERLAEAILEVVRRRREFAACHDAVRRFLASDRIVAEARRVITGHPADAGADRGGTSTERAAR